MKFKKGTRVYLFKYDEKKKEIFVEHSFKIDHLENNVFGKKEYMDAEYNHESEEIINKFYFRNINEFKNKIIKEYNNKMTAISKYKRINLID